MAGKLTLVIIAGPKAGQIFSFEEHDLLLIGRQHDCQVRLPDDILVSRQHAILEVNPPDIRLLDLESLHGTYVNGRKHGGREKGRLPGSEAGQAQLEIELHDGDEIRVGQTVLHVKVEMAGGLSEPAFFCLHCNKEIIAEARTGRPGDDLCNSCRAQARHDPGATLLALLHTHTQPQGINIPNYRIVRELNQGGMGTVYLVQHMKNGRLAALKVMLSEIAVDEHSRQRFLREMHSLLILRHPNVVTFQEGGAQGIYFYFLMEYYEHGSLADLIELQGGSLTLEEAEPIFLQALQGLAFLHQQGFVHRDLTPRNILLGGKVGQWKACLADLGLAKHFDQAGFAGMTMTGERGGFFPFMPHEQVHGFKDLMPASDVWAMGAICYYTLTGTYPRNHLDTSNQTRILLQEKAIPIRTRNPHIPQQVAAVIDRSLAHTMSERYQDGNEMYEALKLALE